jgi:hypothetical protein
MRSLKCNYIEDAAGNEERTRQVASILAAGLERFLKNRKEAGRQAGTALDFPPDLSVTTDCQSNGDAEEG